MPTLADRVRHVIVLMLENRSFDHMLGYVEGVGDLNGDESNRAPWGDLIEVSDEAEYILPADPDHSHLSVNEQLFFDKPNGGFVENYVRRVAKAGRHPREAAAIMRCFKPEKIPVMAMLASNFATCRRWFCSVPGETWPNRNYAIAATSHGQVNISFRPYTDPTVFELLSDHDRSWRIYHHGPAQAWAFPKLWLPFWRHHFKGMDKLFAAIRADELDDYSFVEPNHGLVLDRWKRTSNSQHPGNNLSGSGRDFLGGERLMFDVYQCLRNNPDVFEKTLLVITYDEHGGIYDHQPPPKAAPPDDHDWEGQFFFDRLGPRVPALLISPWLDPQTIDDRVFDHSSIVKSVRLLFAPDADSLTHRDEAADSFHDLPCRDEARDLPAVDALRLEDEPARALAAEARDGNVPEARWQLDSFQDSLVALTEEVYRTLEAETRAVDATRAAALRWWAADPSEVKSRFASDREFFTFMEHVTGQLHAAVDPSAVDLVDAAGRVTERPDEEAVRRAFADLSAEPIGRGKVTLRSARDVLVRLEPSRRLVRLDFNTGGVDELNPPAPQAERDARGPAVTAAGAVDLAALALQAVKTR